MSVWDGVSDRAPLPVVRGSTNTEQEEDPLQPDPTGGAQLLVRFLFENETWMERSACSEVTDPETLNAFFPDRGYSHRKALAVCARCPVTAECEDYAQRTHTEYGVWGGQIRKRGRKTQNGSTDTERELGTEL